MSRTHKQKIYHPFRKEGKWARRLTNDKVRYTNRDVLKALEAGEDPDQVVFEDPPHTGGWITW